MIAVRGMLDAPSWIEVDWIGLGQLTETETGIEI